LHFVILSQCNIKITIIFQSKKIAQVSLRHFIKLKLDIARMAIGQSLKVLLDDGKPVVNVPRSVIDEGHEILEQTFF
jgi:hypothetical protein